TAIQGEGPCAGLGGATCYLLAEGDLPGLPRVGDGTDTALVGDRQANLAVVQCTGPAGTRQDVLCRTHCGHGVIAYGQRYDAVVGNRSRIASHGEGPRAGLSCPTHHLIDEGDRPHVE